MSKRKVKLGRGTRYRQLIRHSTGYDPDTYDEVRVYAEKNNIPFAEAVRQLVEFGLNDVAVLAEEAD